MSGIIITPGTFNPPATPAQTMGVYTFPKKPDVTLRKPTLSYQFSSRRAVEAAGGSASVGILYVRYDYITGLVRIRVADADYNPAATHAALTGARYAPNGNWPVVATDAGAKTYDLATPSVLSAESIDLGSFVVRITHPADDGYYLRREKTRTVEGTATEGDGDFPYSPEDPATGFGARDYGGELVDRVFWNSDITPGTEQALDKTWHWSDYLLADPYPGPPTSEVDWANAHSSDMVYTKVRVTGQAILGFGGTVEYSPLDGAAVKDTGTLQETTLYAPDAGTPVPAPLPTVPVVEYVRESWVHQGGAVLT